MNRWYKLFLILPIIIIGCKNKKIDEKYLSQSINTLDMNIFSKEGEKLISIKSPYSKYDKEKESWIKQLEWGRLIHESILPPPNPIIEKLEYD